MPGQSLFPQLANREPSETANKIVDCLQQLVLASEQQGIDLRDLLSYNVQTMDSIINEESTQPLPTNAQSFTMTLLPQTRQWVNVNGLFVSITNPVTASAAVITITNAWAQIGGLYINLNALINSAGGTGGFSPTQLNKLIHAGSPRTITVVSSANFPAGCFLSAILTGVAIPANLGGRAIT